MTKVTPPRSVKVLGRKVKVNMVNHISDGNVAEWHAATYVIDVTKGQDPLDEADSLLHEVMHATLHCQGRDYGGKTEELYVRALASGLLFVLRENPKFTAYLLQGIPS